MTDYANTTWIANIARWSLGSAPSTPVVSLRLFVGDYTPTCSSALAAFADCTAPGYSAITIAYATWSVATIGCDVIYTLPAQHWAVTSPGSPGQTIYGHYVVDTSHSQIMWAARWDTPLVIPDDGIGISYAAVLTYQQCGLSELLRAGAGVGVRSQVLAGGTALGTGEVRRRRRRR